MKVLLIAGGVLFLVLAFVLFAAAVIVFFVSRSRRARAAAPAPSPARPQPVAPPQPPPPPPPQQRPPDPDATVAADGTVVVDSRRFQQFGALHGVAGALNGRVFPIDVQGFYIGRDKTAAQVVIDNGSVSKRHVWIGVRDGVPVAIDQQSTNGTYLNSLTTRIGEARLSPGDTLIISDDVARLEYRP